MLKKLLCLMMALVMLCLPLALTSCEEEKTAEVVDMSERDEIYLTLYTITDEKTTEEGILRVQEALNEIIFDRYKAHLVLKCYTRDEYQQKLDELYEEFAKLEEEERLEAAKKKEEEQKIREEEKNLTTAEKRKREEERRKAELAAKEQAALEEAARLERIKNGEEDPINGPQLDIFYLPDADSYYAAAADEKLISLDNYLKVDFKEMYDYLSKNLLTNATIAYDEEDAKLYGIPNNCVTAGEGWYYVINTDLVKKYGFEINAAAPQLSDFAAYAQTIADSEPGVIPVANPAPANGIDFYGDVAGFPIAASNAEYGPFESRGVLLTYGENSAARKHFSYMAQFREKGWFIDRATTANDNFFLDFRQGTAEDAAEWEKEGYTVLTYRRSVTETALCRNGFWGISSYCDENYQMRAMEILQALYTNVDLHNIFAFGVLGEDYVVNEDGVTVTRLTDDYVMDFATTGNTLLGYLPEGYPVDYVEQARLINRGARLSGFSSFCMLLDRDEQEWYDEICSLEDEYVAAYEKLCKGTSDWEQICDDLNKKLEDMDISGFVSDVVTDRFRPAAKKVREADKSNYSAEQIYLQSEYDKLVSGGLITEDGDATMDNVPANPAE